MKLRNWSNLHQWHTYLSRALKHAEVETVHTEGNKLQLGLQQHWAWYVPFLSAAAPKAPSCPPTHLLQTDLFICWLVNKLSLWLLFPQSGLLLQRINPKLNPSSGFGHFSKTQQLSQEAARVVVARLHWFSLKQKHCSRSRRRRKRRSSLKKKKKKSWKLLSETLGSCIYRPKKNTSLQKEKLLSPDTKYLSLSLSLLCCPHNLLLLLLLLHTRFISSRQCAAAENTNTISHFSNHFQVHVLSTECKTKMWSQKWGVCVTSPTLLLLSLFQQTKHQPPESSNY